MDTFKENYFSRNLEFDFKLTNAMFNVFYIKKSYFAEIFKKLTRYRSGNNFVGDYHNNYVRSTQADYQNIKIFLQHYFSFLYNYFNDSIKLFFRLLST